MAVQLFTYRRAGAVVVDRGRVLLVSMQPPGQPRWWHFPGGGIEPGETPKEAAIRELFEETGLHATDAVEFLHAGVHGGYHQYFLMTCEDLTIGAVSGPELEYAADADFRAEWVPIADLPTMPVWPRCVAEHLAEPFPVGAGAPARYVEDDRQSWDGVPGAETPTSIRTTVRVVLFRAPGCSQVAAIERDRGGVRYFTLPGGGIEPGETASEAARREAREELGLEIRPGASLAVVVYRRAGQVSLQTYLEGTITGGEFGTGTGDEFSEVRRRLRGTYDPRWLEVGDLPATLRPSWLSDRIPQWARQRPERPERFCELHDE